MQTQNSQYWEDSQLRGEATEHRHIPNAFDKKCAICGMPHKTRSVPASPPSQEPKA